MSFAAQTIVRKWIDWPFFDQRHKTVRDKLDRFVNSGAIAAIDHNDVDGAC